MKGFLEQYGVGIFTLIIIAIFIAFAEPFGSIIKTSTNKQVTNADHISTLEIQKASTPVSEYVYACLYNDGDLVLSSHEIKNKENVMIDYGKTKTNKHPWTGTEKNPNTNVKTVTFLDVVKPINCCGLFSYCESLEHINNIENLDTSECINLGSIFYYCTNLKEVDVSHFDTSKVTQMYCMFTKCEKITSLNLSNFDTSNVENTSHMFNSCFALTTLDLTSFNTSKIFFTEKMFTHCKSLKQIKVSSNWNINDNTIFLDCGTDHVTKQ